MLKSAKESVKKWLYHARNKLTTKLVKPLVYLLMSTCKVSVEGLDDFLRIAQQEKCILILWHNRLAIAPFILSRFTPQIDYAALVSGSRDGAILSGVIHSYKNGHTILVPHHSRYRALREVVNHVEKKEQVVVITPDGPRGPLYHMKPGTASAALETGAYIAALDWQAQKYWKLPTWDGLRLPKPFSKIVVQFVPPIQIQLQATPTVEEAQQILREYLSTHN